jgi:hypothetical protein
VTHHDVSAADIDTVIDAMAASLRETSPRPIDDGSMSAAPAWPVAVPGASPGR